MLYCAPRRMESGSLLVFHRPVNDKLTRDEPANPRRTVCPDGIVVHEEFVSVDDLTR